MTEAGYRPADRLYLWLLAQPQQPLFVGELYLVRAVARVVSGWQGHGFAEGLIYLNGLAHVT